MCCEEVRAGALTRALETVQSGLLESGHPLLIRLAADGLVEWRDARCGLSAKGRTRLREAKETLRLAIEVRLAGKEPATPLPAAEAPRPARWSR